MARSPWQRLTEDGASRQRDRRRASRQLKLQPTHETVLGPRARRTRSETKPAFSPGAHAPVALLEHAVDARIGMEHQVASDQAGAVGEPVLEIASERDSRSRRGVPMPFAARTKRVARIRMRAIVGHAEGFRHPVRRIVLETQ